MLQDYQSLENREPVLGCSPSVKKWRSLSLGQSPHMPKSNHCCLSTEGKKNGWNRIIWGREKYACTKNMGCENFRIAMDCQELFKKKNLAQQQICIAYCITRDSSNHLWWGGYMEINRLIHNWPWHHHDPINIRCRPRDGLYLPSEAPVMLAIMTHRENRSKPIWDFLFLSLGTFHHPISELVSQQNAPEQNNPEHKLYCILYINEAK